MRSQYKALYGYIDRLKAILRPSTYNSNEHSRYSKLGMEPSVRSASKSGQVLNEILTSKQKMLDIIAQKMDVVGEEVRKTTLQSEKVEMVDKRIIAKLLQKNKALKDARDETKEKVKETEAKLKSWKAQLIKLNLKQRNKETKRAELLNEIYDKEMKLREKVVLKEKMIDLIQDTKINKDNIFRALEMVENVHQHKLPKKVKEVLVAYKQNNEYVFSIDEDVKKEKLKTMISDLEGRIKKTKEELLSVKKAEKDQIRQTRKVAIERHKSGIKSIGFMPNI